jgi:hypothetical protein
LKAVWQVLRSRPQCGLVTFSCLETLGSFHWLKLTGHHRISLCKSILVFVLHLVFWLSKLSSLGLSTPHPRLDEAVLAYNHWCLSTAPTVWTETPRCTTSLSCHRLCHVEPKPNSDMNLELATASSFSKWNICSRSVVGANLCYPAAAEK